MYFSCMNIVRSFREFVLNLEFISRYTWFGCIQQSQNWFFVLLGILRCIETFLIFLTYKMENMWNALWKCLNMYNNKINLIDRIKILVTSYFLGCGLGLDFQKSEPKLPVNTHNSQLKFRIFTARSVEEKLFFLRE